MGMHIWHSLYSTLGAKVRMLKVWYNYKFYFKNLNISVSYKSIKNNHILSLMIHKSTLNSQS